VEKTEQEQFLNDFDFIDTHINLKKSHIDFLKTIDENKGNAIRIIIDRYMNHMKKQRIQYYLLFFVLIIDLFVLLMIYFAIQ
jgi:hypothetical protein